VQCFINYINYLLEMFFLLLKRDIFGLMAHPSISSHGEYSHLKIYSSTSLVIPGHVSFEYDLMFVLFLDVLR